MLQDKSWCSSSTVSDSNSVLRKKRGEKKRFTSRFVLQVQVLASVQSGSNSSRHFQQLWCTKLFFSSIFQVKWIKSTFLTTLVYKFLSLSYHVHISVAEMGSWYQNTNIKTIRLVKVFIDDFFYTMNDFKYQWIHFIVMNRNGIQIVP